MPRRRVVFESQRGQRQGECDLRMTELDRRAFYAHMPQRAPALCQRVIVLTGESSAADHQAFVAQCGRPWLSKPCSIAALRNVIQQVLESASASPDSDVSGPAG